MKIIEHDHYYEYKCTEAVEFWHLLDPINPLEKDFTFEEKKTLLYRGQEKSSYLLMPSSFRNNYSKNTETGDLITSQNAFDFIYNEYKLLRDYYSTESVVRKVKGIDKRIDLRTLFEDNSFQKKISVNANIWLEREYFEVVSLAQHHQIPTSLLDWSRKAYISVFFAAEPCVKNKIYGAENLAVWIYLPYENDLIKIKEVPLAFDENMSFQNGFFTFVNQEMKINEQIHIKTVDMICQKENLWKVTLPRNEAPFLMEFCDLNTISAANVYESAALDSYRWAEIEKKEWMACIKNYSKKFNLTSTNQFLNEVE